MLLRGVCVSVMWIDRERYLEDTHRYSTCERDGWKDGDLDEVKERARGRGWAGLILKLDVL